MPTPRPLISSSFDAESTAAEVVQGINLAGKRAVVTGASSGIGVATARALASAGAEVSTVHVYADAAAMEFYMTVSGPRLAEAYSQTRGAATSIQVFGVPTAGIEEMLARQAADGCRVEIARVCLGGFMRSPAPT